MDFDNPVGIKMAGSKHQREGSALILAASSVMLNRQGKYFKNQIFF